MRTTLAIGVASILILQIILSIGGGTSSESVPDTAEVTQGTETPPDVSVDARDLMSIRPRAFTENQGQVPDHVQYYEQGGGVWFTHDGVWFDIRDDGKGMGVVLKQEFVGCNEVEPIGVEYTGWDSNFFYGDDPDGWRTDVPNWDEVWYYDLWDGIDLGYYTNENGLKYDFIVHPGADYEDIMVRYIGAQMVSVSDGSVVVSSSCGNVITRSARLRSAGAKSSK